MKIIVFIESCILFLTTACTDFTEIGRPSNQLFREQVFSDAETADAALSALYYKMTLLGSFASGGQSSVGFLCGLRSGELELYAQSEVLEQFHSNSISPSNPIVMAIWSDCYQIIYSANSAIEALETANGIPDETKRQLTGEALFIRAFCHFYLVKLYGAIPYITSTEYGVNAKTPRTAMQQVLVQVVSDARKAEEILQENYPNDERIRVNRWVAKAFVARVFREMGEWGKAIEYATEIISQTAFFELIGLDSVFLKNSREAIWQLQPTAAGRNTLEGQIFILTGRPSIVALTKDVLDEFEANDLRVLTWIDKIDFSMDSFNYPYKYKLRTGTTPLEEYSMVIRLAELFLIRAEAKAEINDISGALSDLNTVRRRSGLGAIDNTNLRQEVLLTLIYKERHAELFTEWGHHWFDLVRLDELDEQINNLLPIPEAELLINSTLYQNPGY